MQPGGAAAGRQHSTPRTPAPAAGPCSPPRRGEPHACGLGSLCSCFISPEQDSITNISLQAAWAEELRIHGAVVQLSLSVCPGSAAAWLLQHRPVRAVRAHTQHPQRCQPPRRAPCQAQQQAEGGDAPPGASLLIPKAPFVAFGHRSRVRGHLRPAKPSGSTPVAARAACQTGCGASTLIP